MEDRKCPLFEGSGEFASISGTWIWRSWVELEEDTGCWGLRTWAHRHPEPCMCPSPVFEGVFISFFLWAISLVLWIICFPGKLHVKSHKKPCEISVTIYLGYAWESICTKYICAFLWGLAELAAVRLKGSMCARMMGFSGVGSWPQAWHSQTRHAGVGIRRKKGVY